MLLSQFNQLTTQEQHATLQQCCASESWVQHMLTSSPFVDVTSTIASANTHWEAMETADILQAFEAHPKIGDVNSLREKYSNTKDTAGHEQSGAKNADEQTLSVLASANSDYEHKFGYIFIVCATGKSAAQMLEILKTRLPNSAERELPIAAEEQRKITQLRLEKLFV